MNKASIYGLTIDQLTAWLMEHGHKKSRALQVWDWLYRKRVTDFSDMTDVNQECVQLLADHFAIQTLMSILSKNQRMEQLNFCLNYRMAT